MLNFNRIAPYYDTLAKVVFGRTLNRAKSCFLHRLPNMGTAAWIGGGSGEVLGKAAELKHQLTIDFIEMSDRFIAMARRKIPAGQSNRINFIHGDVDQMAPDKKYAAVITFFVIDSYPQKEAGELCRKIFSHLQPGGVWLFADFIPGKSFIQKIMVKIMYLFFRWVADIPANRLPDYSSIFQELNLQVEENQFFYNKMISAKVLRYPLSS